MAAAAMVAAAALALPALASTDPIAPYAGTGPEGFGGDGAAALGARFDSPDEVSLAPNGALLIADTENHRIRRVAPDGTISTVAGTGSEGYNGDSGWLTGRQAPRATACSAASNPIFEWVPSQNGFVVDPPQRQSAMDSPLSPMSYSLPPASIRRTGPVTL